MAESTNVADLTFTLRPVLPQQYLDQIRQQVGSALGGSTPVGGGSVGGGGGGGTVGGGMLGGSSPNMGSASLSAKMAMERSAAGLTGMQFGGAAIAASRIANTADRQAAMIHQGMPGSVLDYRTQTVANNAASRVWSNQLQAEDRANAEMNRNESRYSMALDRANLSAQTGQERFYDRNSARYSKAQDDADFAAFRGAERQAGNYRDEYYSTIRRIQRSGITDSLRSEFSSPTGPSLFERMNNSRFLGPPSGRRMSMLALFGGAEIARDYGALSRAGHVADTRGAFAGMTAYQQAAESIGGGMLGSFARMAVDGGEMAGYRLGFRGQGPSASFGDVEDAVYGAQQSRLNDAGMLKSAISGINIRREAGDINFNAGRFSPKGSVRRAIRAAEGKPVAAMREFQATIDTYAKQYQMEQDPNEQNRIIREMNRFNAAGGERLKAISHESEEDVKEIKYQAKLDVDAIKREGRSLQADAQGRFGEGTRDKFMAGLAGKYADAVAHSPEAAQARGFANKMEVAAFNANIGFQGRVLGYAAAGATAAWQGNGRASVMAKYDSDVYEANSKLDPSIRQQGLDLATAEQRRGLKDWGVRRALDHQDLIDREAVSAIYADTHYTQAGAGILARSETIRRDAGKRYWAALQSEDTKGDAATIQKTMVNEQRGLIRQLREATSVEEISGPLGIGRSSGETVQLLQKIEQNTRGFSTGGLE